MIVKYCGTGLRFYTVSLCTLSRRAQSGRRTSFGRRVWFTELHTVLAIFFLIIDLFIYLFILDIKAVLLFS
jgi:hypothetical protein